MNQTLLSSFGTSSERVEQALAALREGRGVMVLDDEDRENEGDMIFAAETMTVEQMALTIRHGSRVCSLPAK
jgi:3,4-dihydroxy 2-butanone 4-phosphate synthase